MTDVLGNYLGNLWLQKLVDAGVWLGLCTDDPTPLGDPSAELIGGDYLRAAISFAPPSGKAITSNDSQLFVGLSACLITYLGLWDLRVGGHFLLAKKLADPGITVLEMGNFLCAAGDFAIQL